MRLFLGQHSPRHLQWLCANWDVELFNSPKSYISLLNTQTHQHFDLQWSNKYYQAAIFTTSYIEPWKLPFHINKISFYKLSALCLQKTFKINYWIVEYLRHLTVQLQTLCNSLIWNKHSREFSRTHRNSIIKKNMNTFQRFLFHGYFAGYRTHEERKARIAMGSPSEKKKIVLFLITFKDSYLKWMNINEEKTNEFVVSLGMERIPIWAGKLRKRWL